MPQLSERIVVFLACLKPIVKSVVVAGALPVMGVRTASITRSRQRRRNANLKLRPSEIAASLGSTRWLARPAVAAGPPYQGPLTASARALPPHPHHHLLRRRCSHPHATRMASGKIVGLWVSMSTGVSPRDAVGTLKMSPHTASTLTSQATPSTKYNT